MPSRLRILITGIAIVFSAVTLCCQERDTVARFNPGNLGRINYEVHAFASVGFSSYQGLKTAGTNIWINNYDLSGRFTQAGISLAFYQNDLIQVSTSVGLVKGRFAYFDDKPGDDGLQAMWVTPDVNLTMIGLMLGVKTDCFLYSVQDSSVKGINPNCFNKFATAIYGGFHGQIWRIAYEARLGFYRVTLFNPDKVAYYNMQNTEVSRLYFEIRLSYILFNSGNILRFFQTPF